MRKERLVFGLNNKQRIRFVVNGFAMYCTVQDIQNIATTKHRVAVWSTAERLGIDRYRARNRAEMPQGLSWRVEVRNEQDQLESIDVQVDLVDQ